MATQISIKEFIREFTQLVDAPEADILLNGQDLLSGLIQNDVWLPHEYSAVGQKHYQQYLLYCDPMERFSMISCVWRPGQSTPLHDHTVWGLVGVMAGVEECDEYANDLSLQQQRVLRAGDVHSLYPGHGDIHKVSNHQGGKPYLSIHVYGGNIGAIHRHKFSEATGLARDYVSGYDNHSLPNFWA